MAINFSGLGSGLDSQSIISGLVAAESQPLNDLKTTQNNVNAASSTITNFSSKMSAFQSAARALVDTNGFTSLVASSSDTSLTASASGTSTGGTYSVDVLTVAHEQRT